MLVNSNILKLEMVIFKKVGVMILKKLSIIWRSIIIISLIKVKLMVLFRVMLFFFDKLELILWVIIKVIL